MTDIETYNENKELRMAIWLFAIDVNEQLLHIMR